MVNFGVYYFFVDNFGENYLIQDGFQIKKSAQRIVPKSFRYFSYEKYTSFRRFSQHVDPHFIDRISKLREYPATFG